MENVKEEGNEAFKQSKFEEAIAKYGQAIDMDPLNTAVGAQLYCNRAAALMKMNKIEQAELEAEKATQLDPKYVKAHLRRGECNAKMDKYDEAIRDYYEASQLDPSNHDIKQKLKQFEGLRKKHKRKDYYKLLEIENTSDVEVIKKAYKKQAKKFHRMHIMMFVIFV